MEVAELSYLAHVMATKKTAFAEENHEMQLNTPVENLVSGE